MPTLSRGLPQRPHLDIPKRAARELLNAWRVGDPTALDRIRRRYPKFHETDDSALKQVTFGLSDAQLVIAREYGFSNWTDLKERITENTLAGVLDRAIREDDVALVVRLLRESPHMLNLPVRSANWGPPMSHAANLGRLDVVKAIAELGARDVQHAFDRALLHGELECASWLHAHGGKLEPGIVMGACETLNPVGLNFLVELKAPLTDAKGDRLAPLAMVLETYSRNPASKHQMLEIFAAQRYELPDTPMMAFHRGQVDRLKEHLRKDPHLLDRRFTLLEIYPPESGCAPDGRFGLHGTPINGTTLLHLSIDFGEEEIFEWLISAGADVNSRANVDAEGFGGHTPLFNAAVSSATSCGLGCSTGMTRALIRAGASPNLRTTLRKFLDWTDEPRWHEAREVTPVEWGRTFPEQGWVNPQALELMIGAQV